jgi:hypothetical protein
MDANDRVRRFHNLISQYVVDLVSLIRLYRLNGGQGLPMPQAPAPGGGPSSQPAAPFGNLDLSQILRTLQDSQGGANPSAQPPAPAQAPAQSGNGGSGQEGNGTDGTTEGNNANNSGNGGQDGEGDNSGNNGGGNGDNSRMDE